MEEIIGRGRLVEPPSSSHTGRPTERPNASQHATSSAVLAWLCPIRVLSIRSAVRSTCRGSRPSSAGASSSIPARVPRWCAAMWVEPNGVLSPQPSVPSSQVIRTIEAPNEV